MIRRIKADLRTLEWTDLAEVAALCGRRHQDGGDMSEHTPTPWQIEQDGKIIVDHREQVCCGRPSVGCNDYGPFEGCCGNPDVSGDYALVAETSPANAAFIVKAANHFDYLVEALERVVRDINEYEKSNNLAPNPGRTECWDSVAYAKAVLTSIKERA